MRAKSDNPFDIIDEANIINQIITKSNVQLPSVRSEEEGSSAAKCTFETHLVWEIRKVSFLSMSCFCCNTNNDWGLTGERTEVVIGAIEMNSFKRCSGDKNHRIC